MSSKLTTTDWIVYLLYMLGSVCFFVGTLLNLLHRLKS